MRHVGHRVAELHRAGGRAQEAFAEQVAAFVGYVRRVEAGEENLTIVAIFKHSDALGDGVA